MSVLIHRIRQDDISAELTVGVIYVLDPPPNLHHLAPPRARLGASIQLAAQPGDTSGLPHRDTDISILDSCTGNLKALIVVSQTALFAVIPPVSGAL
jgi:hypothetical protein